MEIIGEEGEGRDIQTGGRTVVGNREGGKNGGIGVRGRKEKRGWVWWGRGQPKQQPGNCTS